jgi:transposase
LKSIKLKKLTLQDALIQFNIPTASIIIKWQKDFANFGLSGLKSKPKGRPKDMTKIKRKRLKLVAPLTREEELLKENEALRAENALLKKLHALIQAEENIKQKP